ncbi:MAG TPA: N,N-dimethylformamidase beta subunit family domain-containing protein, partial [Candidatus Binatia bacterium]|nr:N,N-dimethylformamidase beta subunit family domain-containing protein [Candidatus Binatia bacterium]
MRPWAAYRWLDLRGCARGVLLCLLYLALALPVFAANPIQLENAKAGTTDWQITNLATKGEIEGYASLASVNRGQKIRFYVNTSASTFTVEIFRLGWYGGTGGRRMTSPVTISSVSQPAPGQDPLTGLTECNWIQRFSVDVHANPSDATDWASGVYVVKLTRTDTGKQRYIIFVVRDDNRASGFLYAANFITYQAFNNWGGKSLHEANSVGGRARKISFNRPYAGGTADDGAGDFLGGTDYNMVRFLEREGYDVTYGADLDLHRDPALLLSHRAVLFGGSSQYWSWQMRSNLLAAREEGVNLGFFSAGNGYWQVRLEASPLSGVADRTITAYKQDALAEDPFYLDSDSGNDHLVTGRWRDVPLQRAEESLMGGMLDPGNVNGDVVISNAAHWAFANSGLVNGAHLPGLLGQEVDRSYA